MQDNCTNYFWVNPSFLVPAIRNYDRQLMPESAKVSDNRDLIEYDKESGQKRNLKLGHGYRSAPDDRMALNNR